MKTSKKQEPNAAAVKVVDVELNEEQLDVVAGGKPIKVFIKDMIEILTPKHE